jgi:hypothetical protein
MKKIEETIGYFLIALLIWLNIEIIYSLFNCIEDSPTFILPWRVNHTWTLLGLFLSGLSGIFFPFWNVGKHLKTNNVKEICSYRTNYKIDYFLLMMGFMGVLLIDFGNLIFLILGTLFLIICFSLLFILAIRKKTL